MLTLGESWVCLVCSCVSSPMLDLRYSDMCGYRSNKGTPKMILLYTKNWCLWNPCFQCMWCVNSMKSIRLKVHRKILLHVLFICGRLLFVHLFVHALLKVKICVFPELSESLVEMNHWWTFIWTLYLLRTRSTECHVNRINWHQFLKKNLYKQVMKT